MERGAKLWMSIFIIIIMVSGTAGFVINYNSEQGSKVKYGDYSFTVNEKGIFTKINGREVVFGYLPESVEQIETDFSAVQMAKSTLMLYMTSRQFRLSPHPRLPDCHGSYSTHNQESPRTRTLQMKKHPHIPTRQRRRQIG